jgi:sialic acid synthase SpsE
LSDHSVDNTVAISAVALGAEVIEKHIGIQNQKKGLDIKFSLKGSEIKKFKNNIDSAYELIGKSFFYRNNSENKSKIFRRSIFVVENIQKGQKFTKKNIKRIRPGYGLEPKYYEKIIGKISNKKLFKGEPLKKIIYSK